MFGFVIDFQFWTKRSRGSRLFVFVIREGEIWQSCAKIGGESPDGRVPGGGETGGTPPTFKENEAQRDGVQASKEWAVESEHEPWKRIEN